MKHCIKYSLFLVCLGLPLLSWALSTDRQKPADIEADSAVLNHKTGVGIYKGHVRLTQGTTVVTGDTVITYSNRKNQLQKAVAIGKPASYSTLPDNSKLVFFATGRTINYYPLRAFVELIGNALATQGQDNYAGPQIDYDINQETVISPASKQGRTHMLIQPDQK